MINDLWLAILHMFDRIARLLNGCGEYMLDRINRAVDSFKMSRELIAAAFGSDDLIDNVAAFIIVVSTICLVGVAAAGIVVHLLT